MKSKLIIVVLSVLLIFVFIMFIHMSYELYKSDKLYKLMTAGSNKKPNIVIHLP